MWSCGVAAFVLLGACAHEEARPEGSVSSVPHAGVNGASREGAVVSSPPSPVSSPSPEAPAAPPAPAPLPLFAGPSLEGWPLIPAAGATESLGGFTQAAEITEPTVPLYAAPDGKRVVGYTGVGNRLPARKVEGTGCAGGWYEVSGDAYLCAGDGAQLEPRDAHRVVLSAQARKRIPRVERANPYKYGKARRAAPLLARVPTAEELQRLDAGAPPEGLVAQVLDGTYLLSLVDSVSVQLRKGSAAFYQTLAGGYVRAQDVKPFPRPPMHGEHLGKRVRLPLAFAAKVTPLYCVDHEEPTPCGLAEKHARFHAGDEVVRQGRRFLLVRDHLMAPRENVRVARAIPRPKGVLRGEKWVHIDLAEQTLVAYAGDTPVFATLVSSGKAGHDTPDGLFQVRRAFLTKVMNGKDEDGPYSVQEVPWTMYFHGNYALHGAYWHDVFGGTRSHGCVNLPTVDARWLFYWTRPLPEGWTARTDFKGIHVYVTGKAPLNEEADGAKAS